MLDLIFFPRNPILFPPSPATEYVNYIQQCTDVKKAVAIEAQAWSADEEEVKEVPARRKLPGSDKKKRREKKSKAVVDDNDDKISLAPSLELFEGENDNVKDVGPKDEDVADSDDDLHCAIYSLGNY